MLAECFGCRSLILVKDVGGLYDRDPRRDSSAQLIEEIETSELRQRRLETLPFDRVLLDLLDNARLVKRFQLVNGLEPERIQAALKGEQTGTVVYAS